MCSVHVSREPDTKQVWGERGPDRISVKEAYRNVIYREYQHETFKHLRNEPKLEGGSTSGGNAGCQEAGAFHVSRCIG